jgi:hypothetical protein
MMMMVMVMNMLTNLRNVLKSRIIVDKLGPLQSEGIYPCFEFTLTLISSCTCPRMHFKNDHVYQTSPGTLRALGIFSSPSCSTFYTSGKCCPRTFPKHAVSASAIVTPHAVRQVLKTGKQSCADTRLKLRRCGVENYVLA